MKRLPFIFALFLGGLLLIGADGCSSDPNVEGAKLDLKNKDYDRALENLDKALEKNPDNADALELRGNVFQEKAFATPDITEHTTLLQEMMASYDRAVELKPDATADVGNMLDLAYFNEFQRGIQAFGRGQNDESAFADAAIYFENSSLIRPDSTGSYVNRAYALINAGETAEATAPLEMAIDKGDTDENTFVLLADLYRSNENLEKEIALLEKASEHHPGNENIEASLLNAYIRSGQSDRAEKAYRDAISNDPGNKLYHYNLGSLLLEKEQFAEAIQHLEHAIEIDADYANAYYNMGVAYVNHAVAVNEQVNAIDDEIRDNKDSLSDDEEAAKTAEMEKLAEERRTLFENSIEPLEKAKTLSESNGDDVTGICQALFQAYAQTGNTEKAQSYSECAGYDTN